MRQQFLVGASTKHDGELSARPFSRWRLESAPRSSIATSNAPVSIVDLLTRISPYPDIRAHDGRADWVGRALSATSTSNATATQITIRVRVTDRPVERFGTEASFGRCRPLSGSGWRAHLRRWDQGSSVPR